MRTSSRVLMVFTLMVAFQSGLFGQSASLSGTVTDSTGAVLVGAVLKLTNVDTNVAQSNQTNEVGLYAFASIPPGRYQLSAKQSGFKETIKKDLVLHVGDNVSHNFSLELGASAESVTVSGEAVSVNTEDATVGTVIERQVLANMPLNGRSFQGLITLAPGVATIGPVGGGSAGQFVVNGQRSDTNYFTIDGVSANVGAPPSGTFNSAGTGSTPTGSATGGYNNLLSLDAMQEFRISTSNFAPEFGRTPGGQVSLVSRSGTNAFHGALFNYFRNTVLGANDWFLNAAGKPRGVVQQNDFGGVLGGPVVKNKLFFFVSYEGLRLNAPSPTVKRVPSQSARDLVAAANSGGVVGYMAQFANAYPLPDGNPNTPCTTFANCALNYTASFPSKSVLDTTSARLDYTISDRMTIFGRYSHAPSSLTAENSVSRAASDNGNDVITTGWTWILRNSMSNDLRFNHTSTTLVKSSIAFRFAGSMKTIFPQGFAQPPAEFLLDSDHMTITISGLPTDNFIQAPAQVDNQNKQWNITDSFSWVHGSHRFKFGADFRQLHPSTISSLFNWNNQFAQNTTALTGFPSVANVCPASTLPAGAGASVPGYICGQATLSNIQHNFLQRFRMRQFSFFAQDTWKVSGRLTLTYGVRWEINPAMAYRSDNPGFSLQRSTFSVNDLSKVNINPLGTPIYETTYGNFAPRVGLAYQLSDNPRWGRVLRAGYGMFFDTGLQIGNGISGPFNGRFNNQGAGAIAPIVQFPVATSNALHVTPPAPRLTLPVSNGGNDNLADPNFKLPYVHQFNVSIEQQIARAQTLTASYVGAVGRRLIGVYVYPASAGNPAVFAQINPITGAVTPDSLAISGNYSTSDYHSLQTKFQRQFSRGVAGIVSYTWSHSLDNASFGTLGAVSALPTAGTVGTGRPVALMRASSDFDIRHNLALSMVFNSPKLSNPVARAIFGDWSFDPIYHYQTATPLDLLTGITGTIGGTGYAQRPNLIPGVPVYVYGADCAAQNGGQGCPGGFRLNAAPVTAASAASAGCLAPTATNAKGAFCTPATVGTQIVSGNLGRNAVRSFALTELDFSLHREFPVREKIRIRFQGDLFNVFNQPSFGPFSGTVNNPTFGTSTLMANSSLGAQLNNGSGFNPIFNTGGPRNFQFALKLLF